MNFDPYTGRPLVHTIEQTGKRWKRLQLWGVLGMMLGVVACSVDPEGLTFVPVLGLSVYVYGRVGAWWHHG